MGEQRKALGVEWALILKAAARTAGLLLAELINPCLPAGGLMRRVEMRRHRARCFSAVVREQRYTCCSASAWLCPVEACTAWERP